MDLHLNDRVELKKQHPCGCKTGVITRVGMDIKWRCEGCGREIMLPRSKAEKSIKCILEGDAGQRILIGAGAWRTLCRMFPASSRKKAHLSS